MEPIVTRHSFGRRVSGALRLERATYEEVEHDRDALGQAAALVVLSSLSTGAAYSGAGTFIWGALLALLGWIVWASLIYLIGTRLLPQPGTRTDVGELMRTIGFAAAPGLFGVLGLVPLAGPLFLLGVALWMFAATVTAVRQALDFTSTARALGVVVTGWLVYLAFMAVLAAARG